MDNKRPRQNGKSAHRSLVQSKIRVKFGNDEQLESWRCADGLKAGDDLRNKLGLERFLELNCNAGAHWRTIAVNPIWVRVPWTQLHSLVIWEVNAEAA